MTVKPVSLADYAVPASAGKGGGKSTKERADDYERLAANIVEATAATVAETEAQRQLGPTVDDYGYSIEKARIEHELLAAAQEAGKTITPALRAEIAALANQYGLAAAEAAKLAEEHGKMADGIEFRGGLMKDVLQGLRSALADGKLEFQELGDIAMGVLDKIIGKIEDELIDLAVQGREGRRRRTVSVAVYKPPRRAERGRVHLPRPVRRRRGMGRSSRRSGRSSRGGFPTAHRRG